MIIKVKDSLESVKSDPLHPKRWSPRSSENTAYTVLGISINMRHYEEFLKSLVKTGITEFEANILQGKKTRKLRADAIEGSGLSFEINFFEMLYEI